jgi:hypothetical protein
MAHLEVLATGGMTGAAIYPVRSSPAISRLGPPNGREGKRVAGLWLNGRERPPAGTKEDSGVTKKKKRPNLLPGLPGPVESTATVLTFIPEPGKTQS